jgi:hypothetical protein
MSSDPSPDELRSERPARASAAETRFDAAHVRADQAPVERGAGPQQPEGAWLECTVPAAAQQVRLQAEQLAAHLARQQSTIDHRESELNARLAAMENQIRSARLWLDERHAELAEREKALCGAGRQGSVPRASHEAARTNEGQSLEPDAEPEQAESVLAQQRAQLERERRELADSRDESAAAIERDREKLVLERRRLAGERERAGQELARRADELAARQAALESLRADVVRAQRDSLELRLATEELWARLSRTAPPAAATQLLAKIRLELAEEQRLARAELAAERAEVDALVAQVGAAHEKLVAERAEVQAWVNARHAELERAAERLAARERELSERRTKWEAETAAWRDERFRLEQEVRRLARQLQRAGSVAA